jgi:hypothetical protein
MNTQPWGLAICFFVVSASCLAASPDKGWKKEDVNLRGPGGRQIRAIYYPADKAPRMMRDAEEPLQHQKKYLYPMSQTAVSSTGQVAPVAMNVISSPPIDGFVPYMAVALTNANAGEETDWLAYAQSGITGSFLTNDPQKRFTIGLFDSGASASLVGYYDAVSMGIYSHNLVTDSVVPLQGATGTVNALASYPLATFADSLAVVEPNGMLLTSTSGMKGEKNVSVIVGETPASGAPDLPTAVGAPMAVFYSAAFDVGNKVTRVRNGVEYRAPGIKLYEPGDSAIPTGSTSSIPLEIRPSSSTSVSYIGTVDLSTFEFYPAIPSIITDGMTSQSLFFVSSVDLADVTHTATDRTRFMLDTGAQITVVGQAVASRLALNTANPDFQVEITDVTGETTTHPGFYVDSLDIPALGEWFSATNVPVVYLNVASPEGGYLDGIIGMNLFTSYDMVLNGGAFLDPPSLDIRLATNAGDIAPAGGNGKVDGKDLAAICAAWLSQTGDGDWNPSADIAPTGGDGIINFRDFAIVAANWGWVRGQ